ncbi:hypothetical protein ACOSQ4_002707 [Xanthoceras sorbifolium]
MEIKKVDRYKKSHTFDGFIHREFRNDLKECQSFLQGVADKETLVELDATIQNN